MQGYELYLVRHAIAADRGPGYPDDAKRPLTSRGVSRFKEVIAGAGELGLRLDHVFTSPLVRARQTAEYLAAGLPGHPPIAVLEALAPGHTPAVVIAELARRADKGRLALVGHEPDLGQLAAYLVGARRPLPFKKGGICRIDVNSLPPTRGGILVWFAPPKLLRALGG